MKNLYLDRIQITDATAISLLGFVEKSESLLCLSLSENKLTDYISNTVTSVLANNNILEELYLAWNNFTSVGAEPIFR